MKYTFFYSLIIFSLFLQQSLSTPTWTLQNALKSTRNYDNNMNAAATNTIASDIVYNNPFVSKPTNLLEESQNFDWTNALTASNSRVINNAGVQNTASIQGNGNYLSQSGQTRNDIQTSPQAVNLNGVSPSLITVGITPQLVSALQSFDLWNAFSRLFLPYLLPGTTSSISQVQNSANVINTASVNGNSNQVLQTGSTTTGIISNPFAFNSQKFTHKIYQFS